MTTANYDIKIKLILGDITQLDVDVIVNSANKELWKGSGVCGAIHKVAGAELEKECQMLKEKSHPSGLKIGEVIVTKGYNLKAKFVFHTLGVRYNKDDISLLSLCYFNCIKKAEELGLSSIAFPAISTGVYGVPTELSAKIVKNVLNKPNKLKEIILIFSKNEDLEVYQRCFNE